MSSWTKQPTQRDMQVENGIQAYSCLQSCFSLDKGGNIQNCHTCIFQSKHFHYFTNWCIQERIGAVLLQNSKPVLFSSRVLTGSERNYQNLEWECLATIQGMEKFHYLIYGKEFTLEMDQKPLVSIYKKHMVEISPRIQRLIVRSFPYQPFNVQYRKGVKIPLADTLSCVTPLPMEEDGIQLPIIAVNLVTVNIPYSSNELDNIHEETRKDPTIKVLMHYISTGWPCEWRMLPQELHPYQNFWDELSVKDGLVTKSSKLLIPSRFKMLEQIHEGHQGIEKCMLKAREPVYWPGISDDIWEAVEKCGICQSSSRSAKPIGNISEVPPHAWHILGTDLFYWNKMDYLVVGDYFSKYLLVRKIPNSSTRWVIKELGMIFTEFGCPFVLKSDYSPCYTSREFHDFLEFYKIHHITSSPHYSQSNRFAEALVGILKKLMEKSIKDGKPWNYGQLKYRVTLISGNLPSPLEALTGCRMRTSLPKISSSVGKSAENSRICQELIKRQPSTSNHYSMELESEQPVFMKEVHGNVWKTGVINQPAKEPELYWIKFPDNSILRRTRPMIKPRSQPSYFKLEAEGKEWSSTEIIPHSHQPFNSMLPAPELPALPMDNPVLPALTSKATLSVQGNIPVSSIGANQPSISSVPAVIPSTPIWSTHSNKGILPVRFTPSKKWAMEHYGSQWKGYFCFA